MTLPESIPLLAFALSIALSNLVTFALSHQGANRQIRKLFRRKTEGAFVHVNLHYEFGEVQDAKTGDRPFRPCLHITDRSAAFVTRALKGKRFDWNILHSHWLRGLEIDGFYAATWEQTEQYIR